MDETPTTVFETAPIDRSGTSPETLNTTSSAGNYSMSAQKRQKPIGNYSPSWHVIARAQPEAISNSRMETASPLARSDTGNKVNSYAYRFSKGAMLVASFLIPWLGKATCTYSSLPSLSTAITVPSPNF